MNRKKLRHIRSGTIRKGAAVICSALLLFSCLSCGKTGEQAPDEAADAGTPAASASASGTAASGELSSEPAASGNTSGDTAAETPAASREIIVDAPVPDELKEKGKRESGASGTESGTQAGGTGEKTGNSASSSSDTIRLAFCGDIYLSDYVLNAYDSAGGVSGILDQRLLSAGQDADLFIANEEFPFGTTGQPAEDKQYTFRVPPERCRILKEIGVDLVTLANNHTLDYGRSCLEETFAALDAQDIDYMGAGKNRSRASRCMTYEIKGQKIGFLAASRVIPEYGWNASEDQSGVFTTYDPAELLSRIRDAETECDFTVVYVHWGLERHTEPEAYQTELAKQYIDAGADLVIGSHPHVLQPIRFYRNKPIVYSLGNYLFGSSIPSTELLIAEIGPDGALTLSVIPAQASGGKTSSSGESQEVKREGS